MLCFPDLDDPPRALLSLWVWALGFSVLCFPNLNDPSMRVLTSENFFFCLDVRKDVHQ